MMPQREYFVTILLAVVAVLVIVGGYASFNGLAVNTDPLLIDMPRDSFRQSDIFDVNIILNPITFISEETVVIYLDNSVIAAIPLRQYVEDNSLSYTVETRELGGSSVTLLTLNEPAIISLSEVVSLESLQKKSHLIRVEFSVGDVTAAETFEVN
jgi:hypothetical protein